MDGFALIVFGGLAAVGFVLYLIGRQYPGSGAEQLDWKPARSYETQVELEIEDLDQMLDAANRRRRRRGQEELTEEHISRRVAQDLREAQSRREDYLAGQDIEEMLQATNVRRRRRGERELTADEVRAQVEGDTSPPRG